jgi:asparagine synthase (glutamine-hydrolysing)
MCGIFGIIVKNSEEPEPIPFFLEKMKTIMGHRGPDDYGQYISDTWGFSQVRLSIVDIKGGKQPIFNKNENIGIVYNGEVYNYKELEDELLNKGFSFKTKTDTEVVLKLFEDIGVHAFSLLKGMFAFCLWDSTTDSVYLVRDHFGVKPLYIYEDENKLIFSSEIKCLLSIPGLDFSLDSRGIQDYLRFRYSQSPYTMFKKIKRLEAGTYLKITKGISAQFRFWDVKYDHMKNELPATELKINIEKKIENAVKSQLMGEVPVGILLSGGVDSSTIAYYVNKAGVKLKTFNIGFPEVNEFEYSSAVADKFGLEHIEITMTVKDLIKNFDNVLWAIDEPIADPACLPLYYLCRELKKHVTVVLSGEGADELFAGYNQYYFSIGEKKEYSNQFSDFLTKSYYFENYRDFLKDKKMVDNTSRYKKYFDEQGSLLNAMLAYDMKTWIPEDLMMKADKILMAHSLEGRFPFLDLDLFDYASTIPLECKLSPKGETKWILKEIMKEALPEKIIKRKKMGFSVPVDIILQNFKSCVLETIEKTYQSELALILDMDSVRKFVDRYYCRDKSVPALQVWTLFILCYWFVNIFPHCQNSKGYDVPGNRRYIKEKNFDFTPEGKEKIRRELSARYIFGKGIEIGALHCPLWISEQATIQYVDILPNEDLQKRYPEISDPIVHVDIIDDGEKLGKIKTESLDFIIANHFLEHTLDPLGTLKLHFEKIKRNGYIMYAIPNKNYTFDKKRKITSFEHVIRDSQDNGESSKFDHYFDWAENVDGLKDTEKIIEHARLLIQMDNRIHFHVWDTQTFEEFINKAMEHFNNSFQIVHFVENWDEIVILLKKV